MFQVCGPESYLEELHCPPWKLLQNYRDALELKENAGHKLHMKTANYFGGIC